MSKLLKRRSWTGHRRAHAVLTSIVTAATACVVFTTAAATADSIRIVDKEPGQEAAFLAVSSAQFTNQRTAVIMRAAHPTLETRYVDQFSLRMYVDRSAEVIQRRTYYLVWQRTGDLQFRRGLHLYRSEPGMEYPALERCSGIEMKRTSAASGNPGLVTARVPARCVPGSSFIKFNYTVSNFGGNVHDTAPGANDQFGSSTRWIARG